jgi:hypothetical protein
MPIMSLIEKGDTSSKDALDKPKEKRCYFGLLSLRSGTAVISALTLVSTIEASLYAHGLTLNDL